MNFKLNLFLSYYIVLDFGKNPGQREIQYIATYLYGRSKYKIEWPLFLQFILKEEDYFWKRYYELTFIKTKIVPNKYKKEIEEKLYLYINEKFYWLKYKENSCRYDVFSLIYYLVLDEIIKKNENIKEVITFYSNFVNSISLLE